MKSLFLILAFVPRLALADLGDTLAQSARKYGDPSATGSAQILAYVHRPYRIWQSYNHQGVCVIAQFSPLNHGPFTAAELMELDRANHLPGTLQPRLSPGWVQVKWPDSANDRDTISYQYTGANFLYQVIDGQNRDASGWYYSRIYLSDEGIYMFTTAFGQGQE